MKPKRIWMRFSLFALTCSIVFAVTVEQGCSKKSGSSQVPETKVSQLAPSPTPSPATGSVEGRLVGKRSKKPLEGYLVVLCQMPSSVKCSLLAGFKATTDSGGGFVIKAIPAGRYSVAYTKASANAESKLKDGYVIDPSKTGIETVEGGVTELKPNLTVEYRARKLVSFDIRPGETAKFEIGAWRF